MPTPRRIRTGFHRIGVAIAVVIGVPSVGAVLMSLPIGMGWMPKEAKFEPSLWPAFILAGALFLGLALLGYLAAWTLGWIIAGFVGDGA
jgi:hypothetical protein